MQTVEERYCQAFDSNENDHRSMAAAGMPYRFVDGAYVLTHKLRALGCRAQHGQVWLAIGQVQLFPRATSKFDGQLAS